jgi:hypothetical protein
MAEVLVRTLEAELEISGLVDPGAIAEVVDAELGHGYGGHGPVRWPHDSWVELAATPTRFITVVAAEEAKMNEVLQRIETALRRDSRWTVRSARRRPVSQFESEVALKLVKVPRL